MLNMLTKEVEVAAQTPTKPQSEERRRIAEWLRDRIAASRKSPSAEVVTLTPVLAQLLLERNPVNRPIAVRSLEALKADVASRRWEFNGESIVVAKTGTLIDGQHRCQSVIGTGRSIETVIVFGPSEEARYTIDIGRPKTAPNFLHMQGWKDSNVIAAMVSMLLQYRAAGHINHGYIRATKTEIVQAAETFRGIKASVDICRDASKKKLGSHSALAFCHYVFWRRSSRELADQFIFSLIEGDGLRKGSPILYCRERLRGMDRLAFAESRCELILKCWNAWRRGEAINKIVLTGSLPKVER